MAATLLTIARLAKNPDFISRIKVALYQTAISVSNEEDTIGNHAERLVLANKILTDADKYTALMSIPIISNSNIENNDCTDADIQNNVEAVWDIYALGGI